MGGNLSSTNGTCTTTLLLRLIARWLLIPKKMKYISGGTLANDAVQNWKDKPLLYHLEERATRLRIKTEKKSIP